MGEISPNDFFGAIEKEKISYYENYEDIKKNKKSDKEIQNVIKGEKLNDYLEYCSYANEIIPILKKVNEYFIKNCEIHINNNLIIRPVETEIYFVNNLFSDGMCHKNDLQKNRFGQLYFHRYPKKDKNDDSNTIKCLSPKTTWGGFDVCLSINANYYLSILIRSALFINGIIEDKLVSGTRKICDKIKEICFDESNENLQSFFESLEDKEKNKVTIVKRNTSEQTSMFFQPRISGKEYYRKTIEYELNCLNYDFLNKIITTKQTFYNVPNNINKIKEDFEKQRKTIK